MAAGRLSPVTYLEAHLERIAALDPQLNTVVLLVQDEAREAAMAAARELAAGGRRSALAGVPIGLKDLIDLAGHPTTCHSRLRLAHVAAEDAACVARLRAAGAVFPAKLATHEFAIGGPSFDLPFPPARNPWNTAHHPGGSSSGSGAAVAARLLPAALGTDTGGSVRHPASHCGLVGLKPTYGLVSRRGVFPLAWTLDHVGTLARDVRDTAALLHAIAGPDPLDPGSAMRPREDYARDIGRGVTGLSIGFVRHFHEQDEVAADEVSAAIEGAAAQFGRLGAAVREVRLPGLAEFAAVNRILLGAEAGAVHQNWLSNRPEEYSESTRRRLLPGLMLRGVDVVQAARKRATLIAAVEAAFDQVDLLLTASSLDPAGRFDEPEETERTYSRQARTPFNVTGHPAVNLMCGLSRTAGLPLGFQLVGRGFAEATLLRAAAAYEESAGFREARPPGF
jgi:aspartyl-tRNA(Asn)/glutamyl-tRNA(Gln) amidotransferase subunit A